MYFTTTLTRNVRCSLTVKEPMKRSFCGTYPAKWDMALAVIGWPLISLSPDVICSSKLDQSLQLNWRKKMIHLTLIPFKFWIMRALNKVVLPALEGPITARSSPGSTCPLTNETGIQFLKWIYQKSRFSPFFKMTFFDRLNIDVSVSTVRFLHEKANFAIFILKWKNELSLFQLLAH